MACVRARTFKDVMMGKLIIIDKAADTERKNQAEDNRCKIKPIIDAILCGRWRLAVVIENM